MTHLRPLCWTFKHSWCSYATSKGRPFSAFTRRQQEQTYYDTLGLKPEASAGAIKKQYFRLSKLHHPDRNPSDPTASERFMHISEAYNTLSDDRKRSVYDRSIIPASGLHQTVSAVPRGSHSSASVPYGARPASGLSRRRTQFKGPPPSFFRHGGRTYPIRPDQKTAPRSDPEGGMGHGQGFQGTEVPHFNMEGHFKTQMSQEERIMRRRKMMEQEQEGTGGAADVAARFLLISGIVGLAFVPVMLLNGGWGIRSGQEPK